MYFNDFCATWVCTRGRGLNTGTKIALRLSGILKPMSLYMGGGAYFRNSEVFIHSARVWVPEVSL